MSKLLFPIFFATASLLKASIVVWTATGTVSSATGVYAPNGIDPDTPVSIEMKYDDQAGKDQVKITVFGDFILLESDFKTAIDLNISVTIGELVWKGSIGTGGASDIRTLYMKTSNTTQTDTLAATIHPNDGATIELFPFAVDGQTNQIELNFSSADQSFLTDAISVDSFNVDAAEGASGFFQSGTANKVSFTLDPSSIEIVNEVIPTPTPILSLERTNDNLEISWESVLDVNYVLQSSTTLEVDSWSDASPIFFGNGGPLSSNIAIAAGFDLYYRVLAIPAPEL